MDTLDAYKKQLLGIVRSYTGGVTVADLCADTGLRIQTVSTRMAELNRAGRVEWSERRRSASTGAAGKLWHAVAV